MEDEGDGLGAGHPSSQVEAFYWAGSLASDTLGTALGDFLPDSSGLGYRRGALVFAVALAVRGAAPLAAGCSDSVLFWLAFILAGPLGGTLAMSHQAGERGA